MRRSKWNNDCVCRSVIGQMIRMFFAALVACLNKISVGNNESTLELKIRAQLFSFHVPTYCFRCGSTESLFKFYGWVAQQQNFKPSLVSRKLRFQINLKLLVKLFELLKWNWIICTHGQKYMEEGERKIKPVFRESHLRYHAKKLCSKSEI